MLGAAVRILKLSIGATLYLAVFLVAAGFGFFTRFYPPPPPAHFAKPKDMAEAQLQDLAYFESHFALDRSWTPETLAAAKAKLGELRARSGALSPLEFLIRVAQIVALADNGHTQASAAPRVKMSNRIPLRFYSFADGFYVARAQGANADLLRARLEAVDGRPISEVTAQARTLVGGLLEFRDQRGVFVLESPEQLHALGVAKVSAGANYTFRSLSGANIDRFIAGGPSPSATVWPHQERLLSPEPIAEEGEGWSAALGAGQVPLALQEPDKLFRVAPLDSLGALYVELRQNYSAKGQSFAKFLKQATAEIKSRKPENLILDMRFNGGGDYTQSASFMKSLPKLVHGRVFVLTSKDTFSAAVTSVGLLKQAGGARTVIVGDHVGDRLIFYAEGQTMLLPNSGLPIHYATGLHDYKNGCKWFGPCFWTNYLFPISIPTLDPDLSAPFAGSAIGTGRDPALEAIATALDHPD